MERKISKIIENFQCFYEDTFKCLFALKGCGLTVKFGCSVLFTTSAE
jgi:hypothetical protein